jgi:hypothetical protein
MSAGNLIFYIMINAIGFFYVNAVNVNMTRESIFYSNHKSKADFFLTLGFAPIFFFISTIVALRSKHDLNETPCTAPDMVCNSQPYSEWQVLSFNLFGWCTGYLIGI